MDTLLLGLLPGLSEQGRRLLSALVRNQGRSGPVTLFASTLGLRDRHQLTRLLKREGLPPLEELCGWVSVILWVAQWEREGTSLFRTALDAQREPATCYRTVRRVTGVSWRDACRRGLPWLLLSFRERCANASEKGTLPQSQAG